jgi:hypothetical protein
LVDNLVYTQRDRHDMTITNEKRSLFKTHAKEFEATHLLEPLGHKHLNLLKGEREEDEKLWAEIKKRPKKKAGQ